MSNIKYDNPVEQRFHDDLYGYLRSLDLVDERMPEAPDLDDLWFKIGQSYMTDGILNTSCKKRIKNTKIL